LISLKGLTSEELNGFVDQGSEIVGELRFRDTFRVDGLVRGRVVSQNALIVGENGRVEGEVECGEVTVRGALTGRVQARDKIELLAGCRVHATLVTPKLLIEDGAFFEGECEMKGSGSLGTPAPAGPPSPPEPRR